VAPYERSCRLNSVRTGDPRCHGEDIGLGLTPQVVAWTSAVWLFTRGGAATIRAVVAKGVVQRPASAVPSYWRCEEKHSAGLRSQFCVRR